jgi:hypothetical protein
MVLDQKASAPQKYLVRFQHVNHHPVLNSYRVLAVGGVVQLGRFGQRPGRVDLVRLTVYLVVLMSSLAQGWLGRSARRAR